MCRILIVEVSKTVSPNYADLLGHKRYSVDVASSVPQAARLFAKHNHGVVVLDLLLGCGTSEQLLRGILAAVPNTQIVVITAGGSMRQAAAAMENGAFDFLVRPLCTAKFLDVVENAQSCLGALNAKDNPQFDLVNSAGFEDHFHPQTHRIASSTADILLSGATEKARLSCAHTIHQLSSRALLPFKLVRCAEMGEDSWDCLMSDRSWPDGGTLFFDNICDLELGQQTDLLRFLQTSVWRHHDGQKTVDARLVCGTAMGPEQAVDSGVLREDLFYRLNVARIDIPCFSGGICEVELKTQQILQCLARKYDKPVMRVSAPVNAVLKHAEWPGGMAELYEILKMIVMSHEETELLIEMLPPEVQAIHPTGSTTGGKGIGEKGWGGGGIESRRSTEFSAAVKTILNEGVLLVDVERAVIEQSIVNHGGSIPYAAQSLGVAPSTIYRKKASWEKA